MRIGELAERSGVASKTLRFYEQSGLLPEPARTTGGYRDYGPEFIERLHFIRRAQAAGLALKEVREILGIHDRGLAPCGQVVELLAERLEQVRRQMHDLAALESNLDSLLARARRAEPDAQSRHAGVCWILESTEDSRDHAR